MQLLTLDEVLQDQLADLYSAEKQLISSEINLERRDS